MQELGITSDEALVLDNVPEGGTIVIVGAGYIAVEFAGALWVAPALLTALERWNASGVQGVGCIAVEIAGASGAC